MPHEFLNQHALEDNDAKISSRLDYKLRLLLQSLHQIQRQDKQIFHKPELLFAVRAVTVAIISSGSCGAKRNAVSTYSVENFSAGSFRRFF